MAPDVSAETIDPPATVEAISDQHHPLHEAFTEHSAHLHQRATKSVGAHAADDIVQETYLRALGAWDTYDSTKGTLGQWLHGIGRRATADHHRTAERHRRNDQLLIPRHHTTHEDDLIHRLAAPAIAATAIAAAIISPGDHDLLDLIAQGATIAAAATLLGLNPTTARTRLHALRRRIRATSD